MTQNFSAGDFNITAWHDSDTFTLVQRFPNRGSVELRFNLSALKDLEYVLSRAKEHAEIEERRRHQSY